MPRLALSLAALLAALATSAQAADWLEEWGEESYRTSYGLEPKDWTTFGDETDSLHFETGLRYWYSFGSQGFEMDAGDFEESDSAHTVEAHLRIEDDFTSTYAKGWAGYSAAINGTYSDPLGSDDVIDGTIGYLGGDFGWNAFSDGQGNGFGGFFGYNYWNNSPRTGRASYATITGPGSITSDSESGIWSVPGDSVDDRIELHMLRLGLSGKASFGNGFDISGEIAAVPYASISGVIGGHALGDPLGTYAGCAIPAPGDCGTLFFKNSPTEISGWGYGAMGELMAGFKPTENITIRFGGRAWYLTGTYDATFAGATVTPPQLQLVEDPDSPGDFIPDDPPYSAPTVALEDYVDTANPFSMLRYGLLAELTYSF